MAEVRRKQEMDSSSDQNVTTSGDREALNKVPSPFSGNGLTSPLISGTMIDGYELIRPIGQGGFGTVWLVRSVVTGGFQALKYVKADDPKLLEKELQALERFKRAASRLNSMHIVPIEHVNRFGSGVVYVMPLADGMSPVDPVDESWVPDTLAARIDAQRDRATWFDSNQIVEWFTPLIEAVAELTDLGLVHRDIKPENVLFINGRPCLGDISLLTDDAATVSQRGTPGYVAPSWYLASGGHPDLWGLASTFFALLSGSPPDRIGRAAFLWPPQGISSMDKAQQQEWSYFHSLTLRATCETPSERFPQIRDFAAALVAGVCNLDAPPDRKNGFRSFWQYALGAACALVLGLVGWQMLRPTESRGPSVNSLQKQSKQNPAPVDKRVIGGTEINETNAPHSTLAAKEAAEISTPPGIVEIPRPIPVGEKDYFTPQEYADREQMAFDQLDYRVLGWSDSRAFTRDEFRILQAELPHFCWYGKADGALDLVQSALQRLPKLRTNPAVQALKVELEATDQQGQSSLEDRLKTSLDKLDRLIETTGHPSAVAAKIRLLVRFGRFLPAASHDEGEKGLDLESYSKRRKTVPAEIKSTIEDYLARHPRDARFMANIAKLFASSGEAWVWGDAKSSIQKALEWSRDEPEIQAVIQTRIENYRSVLSH